MPSDGNTSLLTRPKIFGVALETTSGTVASVTAAASNTVVYDATIDTIDVVSDGERRPHATSLGRIDSAVTKKIGQATFRTELRHNDATFTLLQGCGYAVSTNTASPTTDVSARKTVTLKLWEDGRIKSLKGAAGDFSLTGPYAGIVNIDWTFTGVWVEPSDGAMPATSALNSKPMIGNSATIQLASTNIPNIANVGITANNQVSEREDITVDGGVLHYIVTDRGPQVTMDMEARLVADYAAHAILLAATTAALSYVLTDGTNTMTIAAPRLQRIEMASGDRGGKLTDDVTFQCSVSDTDDELTFTKSA